MYLFLIIIILLRKCDSYQTVIRSVNFVFVYSFNRDNIDRIEIVNCRRCQANKKLHVLIKIKFLICFKILLLFADIEDGVLLGNDIYLYYYNYNRLL
jgi:hypothetical protein